MGYRTIPDFRDESHCDCDDLKDSCNRSQTDKVIIFDWDDTICPSSFVDRFHIDHIDELPLKVRERCCHDQLNTRLFFVPFPMRFLTIGSICNPLVLQLQRLFEEIACAAETCLAEAAKHGQVRKNLAWKLCQRTKSYARRTSPLIFLTIFVLYR
jgi:hypothetical protein